jgi:hypothetical protein
MRRDSPSAAADVEAADGEPPRISAEAVVQQHCQQHAMLGYASVGPKYGNCLVNSSVVPTLVAVVTPRRLTLITSGGRQTMLSVIKMS